MPNIIYEYLNEENQVIRIEAVEGRRETTRSGSRDENTVVKRVQMKFEEALGPVKAAASGLKKVIDQVNPDEASVEFMVKASGEAGFFNICKAATEAEFKITLTWKSDKKENE
jgi:hypothetical protein